MKQFNFDLNDVKNCITNSNEILSLPMFPELEIHEINFICDSIKQFFLEKNLLCLETIQTKHKSGLLHCINNINFDTKRFFYLENSDNSDTFHKRGLHANLNFNEFIFVINGSIKITLTDKNKKIETYILHKNNTCFVPSMKWIEYEFLDQHSIMVCLVDKPLNESISESNFDTFIGL